MNKESIYSQIIDSKTGIKIPLFKSGRTVESRYDPQKDCQRTAELQISAQTKFYIVLGVASGILIKTILELTKNAFVLAVETSNADIEFLKQLKTIKDLCQDKRVCLCTYDCIEEKIVEHYIPAFYGNLKVIEQRGWVTENQALMTSLQENIQNAISKVAADFSVQSHFGKIWQHNILSNLHFIKDYNFSADTKKTAVIVAAGPSLDKTIALLKQQQQESFIIATDTAFSILCSYNIKPQAVVSLDGQNISNIHFLHQKEYFSDTLFLFDLCANPSAVKKVYDNETSILFFHSGHPFARYLFLEYNLVLPEFFAGAGTVTICAVDFAIKAGFTNIKVYGADFAYSVGKPYSKGTYLDKLYGSKAQKSMSLEKQFSTLMFRTELKNVDNKKHTTTVLNSYKSSFEKYLFEQGAAFFNNSDIYEIKVNTNAKPKLLKNYCPENLNTNKIASTFTLPQEQTFEPNYFELSPKDISLLPLISWFRYNDNKNEADFKYFYNLAINYFKKYL